LNDNFFEILATPISKETHVAH